MEYKEVPIDVHCLKCGFRRLLSSCEARTHDILPIAQPTDARSLRSALSKLQYNIHRIEPPLPRYFQYTSKIAYLEWWQVYMRYWAKSACENLVDYGASAVRYAAIPISEDTITVVEARRVGAEKAYQSEIEFVEAAIRKIGLAQAVIDKEDHWPRWGGELPLAAQARPFGP